MLDHVEVGVKMLHHVPGDDYRRQTHATVLGRGNPLGRGEVLQPENVHRLSEHLGIDQPPH